MKFIEATESAWSAEQLAAAEREIEEQKREWEQNRLAAMKEEEERRARELEEEGDIITFSREDAGNQVSSKTKKFNRTSRLLNNKDRRGRKKSQLTSEGKQIKKLNAKKVSQKPKETPQEPVEVFESSQMEESQNTDTDDNTIESGESDKEESLETKGVSNHVDHNSPRTRSRGTVAINLWTLDVSPILPGEKPMRKQGENKKYSKRYKSVSVSEDDIDSQPDSDNHKTIPTKRKRRRKNNSSLEPSEDEVANEDKEESNVKPGTIITKSKNCKVVLNNIMSDKRYKIKEILKIKDEMEIATGNQDETSIKKIDINKESQVINIISTENNINENKHESISEIEDGNNTAESSLDDILEEEFPTKDEDKLDESCLNDILEEEFPTNDEEVDEDALLNDTKDENMSDSYIKKDKADKGVAVSEEQDTTDIENKNDNKPSSVSEDKDDREFEKYSIIDTSDLCDWESEYITNYKKTFSEDKYTNYSEPKEGNLSEQQNTKEDALDGEKDTIDVKHKEKIDTYCVDKTEDQLKIDEKNKEHVKLENEVKYVNVCDNKNKGSNVELHKEIAQSDSDDYKLECLIEPPNSCNQNSLHLNTSESSDLESPKENIINNKCHLDNGVSELNKIPTIVTFDRNVTFRSPEPRKNYKKFGKFSNNRTLDGWVKRKPADSVKFGGKYGRPDSCSGSHDKY